MHRCAEPSSRFLAQVQARQGVLPRCTLTVLRVAANAPYPMAHTHPNPAPAPAPAPEPAPEPKSDPTASRALAPRKQLPGGGRTLSSRVYVLVSQVSHVTPQVQHTAIQELALLASTSDASRLEILAAGEG